MTSFKRGTIYLENTRAIISKHAYKGERKNCYFRPEQFKDRTLELPSTCNGIFFCGKKHELIQTLSDTRFSDQSNSVQTDW